MKQSGRFLGFPNETELRGRSRKDSEARTWKHGPLLPNEPCFSLNVQRLRLRRLRRLRFSYFWIYKMIQEIKDSQRHHADGDTDIAWYCMILQLCWVPWTGDPKFSEVFRRPRVRGHLRQHLPLPSSALCQSHVRVQVSGAPGNGEKKWRNHWEIYGNSADDEWKEWKEWKEWTKWTQSNLDFSNFSALPIFFPVEALPQLRVLRRDHICWRGSDWEHQLVVSIGAQMLGATCWMPEDSFSAWYRRRSAESCFPWLSVVSHG